MVAGIDKYLMRAIAASVDRRAQYWKPDYSSVAAYTKSVQPNRDRLKKILGVVDPRLAPKLEYVGSPGEPARIADGKGFKVYAVRWAVFPGVNAEGLLLEPDDHNPAANLIAIPDADWTPEMLAGLMPGAPQEVQIAFDAAANGFRVLIPTLIDRKDDYSGSPQLGRFTNQPHREFLYRMSYEMGRHILGYEVQKVLVAVDWMQAQSKGEAKEAITVEGFGQGGLIARLAAAVDERIKYVAPLGQGGPAETMWAEPIYRNIWGFLREFGTAELTRLIMPRFRCDVGERFAVGRPVLVQRTQQGRVRGCLFGRERCVLIPPAVQQPVLHRVGACPDAAGPGAADPPCRAPHGRSDRRRRAGALGRGPAPTLRRLRDLGGNG